MTQTATDFRWKLDKLLEFQIELNSKYTQGMELSLCQIDHPDTAAVHNMVKYTLKKI